MRRVARERFAKKRGLNDLGGSHDGPTSSNGPGVFAEPDAYVQLLGADGTLKVSAAVALPVDARDRAIARSVPASPECC